MTARLQQNFREVGPKSRSRRKVGRDVKKVENHCITQPEKVEWSDPNYQTCISWGWTYFSALALFCK